MTPPPQKWPIASKMDLGMPVDIQGNERNGGERMTKEASTHSHDEEWMTKEAQHRVPMTDHNIERRRLTTTPHDEEWVTKEGRQHNIWHTHGYTLDGYACGSLPTDPCKNPYPHVRVRVQQGHQ
ncbi:hypothetical protein BU15DRAFT_63915 [Melanogaster broomeanus]|nr:hypothetical protein BU15DRAFT_63915 [Melanogaster broomeanus]